MNLYWLAWLLDQYTWLGEVESEARANGVPPGPPLKGPRSAR